MITLLITRQIVALGRFAKQPTKCNFAYKFDLPSRRFQPTYRAAYSVPERLLGGAETLGAFTYKWCRIAISTIH